jgi:hypothetical protein
MNILNVKAITRPASCMNLLWMLCNGISTYDQAVEAMIKHEEFYQTNPIMNDNGRNFTFGPVDFLEMKTMRFA